MLYIFTSMFNVFNAIGTFEVCRTSESFKLNRSCYFRDAKFSVNASSAQKFLVAHTYAQVQN